MQANQFKGEITVTVDAPEQRVQMGGAAKHHSYRIHGRDDLDEFQVWRRYSDFVLLKQYMTNRWPGIYVPSLPEKKFLGNNESNFVEIRRDGLEDFLELVRQQPHLWYGDEFQLFIKSKSTDVDKFLTNLGKTNNRDVATKFRIKFPHVFQQKENKQTDSEIAFKISQFRNYLKITLVSLEKVMKVSDQMTENRKRYSERYESLLSNIIFNYEEKCISEYTENKNDLWFLNSKMNGIAQREQNLFNACKKNPASVVNQLIKEEIRQIQNFQTILKNKEQFELTKLKLLSKSKDLQIQQTKINAGKESLLNKIKSASKEQQLQQNKRQLDKVKQELKDSEEICKIIDKILAGDQIQRFKKVRQSNYYKVIREMAKLEKEIAEKQEELWIKIAGNDQQQAEFFNTSEEQNQVLLTYPKAQIENKQIQQKIDEPVIVEAHNEPITKENLNHEPSQESEQQEPSSESKEEEKENEKQEQKTEQEHEQNKQEIQ